MEAAMLSVLVLGVAFAYVAIVAVIAKVLAGALGVLRRWRWRYSNSLFDEEPLFDSPATRHAPSTVTKKRIAAIIVILALVLFVVPYQVAYVLVLLNFLWDCAAIGPPSPGTAEREHVLVLLLVLLPLQAPVLPVWIRTLLTAGYTTPFDGDHNILMIAPLMVLAGFASRQPGSRLWLPRGFSRSVCGIPREI